MNNSVSDFITPANFSFILNSKYNYICDVKIKSVLTLGLILLTLLCSTEGFSRVQLLDGDQKNEITQFVELAQDVSQDFRESFKVNLSGETESFGSFIHNNSFNSFSVLISQTRYQGYLKAYLSKTPLKKLFIDFGSMLI